MRNTFYLRDPVLPNWVPFVCHELEISIHAGQPDQTAR